MSWCRSSTVSENSACSGSASDFRVGFRLQGLGGALTCGAFLRLMFGVYPRSFTTLDGCASPVLIGGKLSTAARRRAMVGGTYERARTVVGAWPTK